MSILSSKITNFLSFESLMKIPITYSIQTRYKYFAEKEPTKRAYGYKDKLAFSGTLPRDKDKTSRIPGIEYMPKKAWSEKKALFGQNDYIDILGDEGIHPMSINYSAPSWLRGFGGNEFQMLIRKKKLFGQYLKYGNPDAYNNMTKRIDYLYKKLNYKSKDVPLRQF